MKKKNGFIATSLIYSFFLIFCALLLSFVSVYLHNKVLLANITDKIKEELSTKKIISSYVKTNDYSNAGYFFKFPVFYDGASIGNVMWVSVNAPDSNNVILESTDKVFLTPNFDTYNNTNLLSEVKSTRSLYLNSAYVFKNGDWQTINGSTNMTAEVKNTLLNPNDAARTDNIYDGYLLDNGSSTNPYSRVICTYKDSSNLDTASCNPKSEVLTYNASDLKTIGVRLFINVPNNIAIEGGNGTNNNPFIIKYYSTNGLVFHLDANNSSGQLSSSGTTLNDLSGNTAATSNSFPASISSPGSDVKKQATISSPITTSVSIDSQSISNGLSIEIVYNKGNTLSIGDGTNSLRLSGITLSDTINTVSLVKNGTSMDVYVKGEKTGNITYNLNSAVGSKLVISGTISSLRVYNRNLSESEIKNNYDIDREWVYKL